MDSLGNGWDIEERFVPVITTGKPGLGFFAETGEICVGVN